MGVIDIDKLRGLAPAGARPSVGLPITWIAELGLLPGCQQTLKFGYNPQISPSAGAPGDIWPGTSVGGERNYAFNPSIAETLTIQSSSAADTYSTGTNAWRVLVQGLDNDFNPVEEIFQLNGVTPVPGIVAFRRVFRARVIEGGNLAGDQYRNNLGDILIKGTTTPVSAAIILANIGQTTQCNYTIRDGYTGLVVSPAYQTFGADRAEVGIVRRPPGEPVQTSFYGTANSVVTHLDSDIACWKVEERTDIQIVAFPSTQNMQIAAWYVVFMIANKT